VHIIPYRKFSTVLPIQGGRKEGWKMKGICPNCEKETELELIHRVEDIKVRGEAIKVEVKYYKCKNCGEEFEDPHSDEDSLDKAYREYRQRHGMMQPEEVRADPK